MKSINFRKHFPKTITLAYPVMLSQLGQVSVGVADSMMVGRLGAETLAAASLGNSIFFVVMMFGIGVSMAITPLVAAADGEGRKDRITGIFKHGLVINTWTSVLLSLLILLGSPLLFYLDQPVEVVDSALPYLGIITFSLIPFMFFQTFKQFTEGLSQTKQAMVVIVLCNLVNIFLNWVLIFGNLGMPALGLNGAGWATFISRVLMGAIMFYYVWKSKRYRPYKLKVGFGSLHFPMISKMLKIGVPTGFQFIFETGAFSAATILMGWIGVNALAAHQIALNLSSISYMMASGLSAAAMVRVGNQLGKNDIKAMREIGFTSFAMAIIFMLFFAILLIAFRHYLPLLYISDASVITMTAGLLVIAGLFQLSDGVQVVGLGALRGMADVRIPTLITLGAYWAIGLPFGYLLAFPLGLGEKGVWYGLLVGLTSTALLLVFRFHRLSKKLLINKHSS